MKISSNKNNRVKLTRFSHGAGCGCKISPAILNKIIDGSTCQSNFPNLLVGNNFKDDAAVMETTNGQVIISTTDFFMPIVDDAFDFGRIASANAISDIYAMGGLPLMAIAILGWPIDKIPAEIAKNVMEGARLICEEANIPIAGGHSIDSPEPIFGLAVTGLADKNNIKKNNGAKEGDFLFLTKPLGVGIYSTASKKELISNEDLTLSIDYMTRLNKVGSDLGKLSYVHSMTDITGFGLLGHLIEMCEGSQVSAQLNFNNIPFLPRVNYYLDKECVPGGTNRNWESYGQKINTINERTRFLLADPQTSGGLLVAINESDIDKYQKLMNGLGFDKDMVTPIGKIIKKDKKTIYIM
jgi:selenide,water dikinase